MKFKQKKLSKSAFTYEGYQQFKVIAKKEAQKAISKTFWQKLLPWTAPKPTEKLSSYSIYCGPLKDNETEILDLLPSMVGNQMTSDIQRTIEQKWKPNPQLTVYDQSAGRALTAAEASEKRSAGNRWMPIYFQNPLQSYDYMVYESLVKNTLLGPVMRTLVKFIMGTGFRPELELRMPSNDAKADAKLVKDGEEIISKLNLVDRAVSEKADTDGIDISFERKMTNMIQNMLIYNRSCGVFVYDTKNPIEIDGKKYPQLPVNIVDFHPRDMGLVKISPTSHKMTDLQINQITGFVSTDEMIYLWNSEYGGPIWNSKYYGGSMMMPMIDPARIIQSQMASILPAISDNMATGLYHIFVEPQGGTETQKLEEYRSITENVEFGTSNVFMIDPERVKYENVNFDPKIGELIELFNMLVKYILAAANVPQIGMFDEAAANHATAVEKIQLTISTVINPMREWIGEEIARQWYNRIYKVLYSDNEELLKRFRIKVVFDDLQIETLSERAESLETVERRAPLTHEKAGEILQIDGYEDNIDPDREAVPAREEFEVKTENEKFKVKSNGK